MTRNPLAQDLTPHAKWIWRGGELFEWESAVVHVSSAGHTSAASIFEGIRAYRDTSRPRLLLFRLDEHLRRFFDSARVCRLRLPFDAADLRRAVIDLLRANAFEEDIYVRLWAFPAGVIREQMVPEGTVCEVVIDSWPARSELAESSGCRASVSSWIRVSDAAMPPRVKAFSNYHNGRLAMMEARANGHDWPILLNERHQVSEAPGACVALVRDGAVATPTLTSGVLPGITRATILTLLAEMGVPAHERELDRSELYLAEELFFMGTGWEILPATAIDGLPVGDGAVGPVTSRLRAAYADLVRGRSARHPEWLTEVPC